MIDADCTNGAHYYANLHTMESGGWFERPIVDDTLNHPQVAVIGHHTKPFIYKSEVACARVW
jgi:hypothetical protein